MSGDSGPQRNKQQFKNVLECFYVLRNAQEKGIVKQLPVIPGLSTDLGKISSSMLTIKTHQKSPETLESMFPSRHSMNVSHFLMCDTHLYEHKYQKIQTFCAKWYLGNFALPHNIWLLFSCSYMHLCSVCVWRKLRSKSFFCLFIELKIMLIWC